MAWTRRARIQPETPWIAAQDPYLIRMLLDGADAATVGLPDASRALWDEVRQFVTCERLGYDTTRMAEVFPADWDALYQGGFSPEMAVRLVVWSAGLADLLDSAGARREQFRFDFDRAFLDGCSPFEAVHEALGLAVYAPPDGAGAALRGVPARGR
jgi:hypothetical protein